MNTSIIIFRKYKLSQDLHAKNNLEKLGYCHLNRIVTAIKKPVAATTIVLKVIN